MRSHKFDKAIEHILAHEGGYNDISEDKGGATNWGISLRFLESQGIDIDGDGDVDWMDVKKLTRDGAINLYHRYFWIKEYDSMNINIAAKVFDMGVNMGLRRAGKILQQAVNNLNNNLAVDGVIGPKTLAAVRTCGTLELLTQICFEQAAFYIYLVLKDASQIKFLKGWHNRSRWIPNLYLA